MIRSWTDVRRHLIIINRKDQVTENQRHGIRTYITLRTQYRRRDKSDSFHHGDQNNDICKITKIYIKIVNGGAEIVNQESKK